jgi:hypothetical protein
MEGFDNILPLGSIVAKVPQPEYGRWIKVPGGYQLVAWYPLQHCFSGKHLFNSQEWRTILDRKSWVRNLGRARSLCHGQVKNNGGLLYRIFHHFLHLVLEAVSNGEGIFHFPNQNKITISIMEYSDPEEIAKQMGHQGLKDFWLNNFDIWETGGKYYKCKLLVNYKGRTIVYNIRQDKELTAKFVARANTGKGFSKTKLTMSDFLPKMSELYPWLTQASLSKVINTGLYRLNKALKGGEFYYFTISEEHNYNIMYRPKDPVRAMEYLKKQLFKRQRRVLKYGAVNQQIYKTCKG